MRYARYWGAIASHSGDAYFDFIYRSDWPNTLNELARYRRPARQPGTPEQVSAADADLGQGIDDGRVRRFLEAMWRKHKLSHGEGTRS